MKRRLLAYTPLAAIVASFAAVAAVVPNQPKTLTVAWDGQAAAVDTYKIYYSTNLALPMFDTNGVSTWGLVTNVPGTNLSASFVVPASTAFLFVTASNAWGESSNSNILAMPAAPVNSTGLKVQGVK